MAALTVDQITLVYKDGDCSRTALFSLKNVTATDTLDLGSYFKYVKRAGLISDTGTTVANCAISAPTGLTVPTGPLNDAVWLLVVGIAT